MLRNHGLLFIHKLVLCKVVVICDKLNPKSNLSELRIFWFRNLRHFSPFWTFDDFSFNERKEIEQYAHSKI
jgi:hypothetical protein